jgi:hypothetical protein
MRPATAVAVNFVFAETAPGGTMRVSPASGIVMVPPALPITALTLTSFDSAVVRVTPSTGCSRPLSKPADGVDGTEAVGSTGDTASCAQPASRTTESRRAPKRESERRDMRAKLRR